MSALDRWFRLAERAVCAAERAAGTLDRLLRVAEHRQVHQLSAPANNDDWLSVADVAELSGLSPATVRRKMGAREMPGVDGPWRVRRGTLLRWLEAQEQGGVRALQTG